MSHEKIYSTIVNAIGFERCCEYLPVKKEEIEKKIKEDEYLNNIPLMKWDSMHYMFKGEFKRIGIDYTTLSDTVCTLKQCARMLVNK
jgi:hypothetical protein